MKNKLFFFGSWERYQEERGFRRPSPCPRRGCGPGDFSEVAAVFPDFRLYDPLTGSAGGRGPRAVPEQPDPGQPLNPTAQSDPGRLAGAEHGRDLNRNGIADDYVSRAPHVRPRQLRRQAHLAPHRPRTRSGPSSGCSTPRCIDNFMLGFDQGSPGDTRTYVGTFGHTWTLSPSLVLDGNFGVNRMEQSGDRSRTTARTGHRPLGHPRHQRRRAIRYSGLPLHQRRPTTFGTTPNWMPLFRTEQSYTFCSALTKVLAKHELRFGVDVVKHELNHWQAEFGTTAACAARSPSAARHRRRRATSRRSGTVRRVPARPAVVAEQERAGDRDDRPRVADGGLTSATAGRWATS